MAYRVIIWGLGKYLENELEKKIIDEINKENIEVVAEIDKNISKHVFCDSQIYPSEIKKNYYDYLIITSENNSAEITEEALKVGVERERIIYGKLLMDNGFDFLTYKEKGWLNNRIFNDTICVTDYTDDLRVLKGKKIKVSLGRKSSIGLTRLVTGGNPNEFLVTIGNFTNISWDGVFELGLNLDHNYKRVLNYGLTHLLDDYSIPDDKPETLIIGSDVWVGRNVVLKSGISIGDGAVVASNSVVTSDVPPYALVGGNPAKLIKYRFSDEMIKEFLKLKWWNWPINRIMEYSALFETPKEFLRVAFEIDETGARKND